MSSQPERKEGQEEDRLAQVKQQIKDRILAGEVDLKALTQEQLGQKAMEVMIEVMGEEGVVLPLRSRSQLLTELTNELAAAVSVAVPAKEASPPPAQPVAEKTAETREEADLKAKLRPVIHSRLIAEIEPGRLSENIEKYRDEVTQRAAAVMKEVLAEQGTPLPLRLRNELASEVLDEIFGYGPLQPLLNDPEVSEIVVNSHDRIFVEKHGRLVRSEQRFNDDSHAMRIIDKILGPLGRRVSERTPMQDGRLPDGSRVNVIIPPLALHGPAITIRKFSKDPLQIEDLIRFGALTAEMAEFVKACVHARLNIIVSGGTGSGKTTTLNVLSSFIPEHERLVTAEDAAELQIRHEDVVTLESRPPNIEGEGAVSIRDLVRNALRMRPDRIIVGEVRGGECLDMLQAMNTGHDGSLSTVHSNAPRDTVSRMETMALMAGVDLPLSVISKQIASAVQLIVHQNRLSDGSRKITSITEIQGMEGPTILLQDIFVFEQSGIDTNGKIIGKHKATGFRPKCMPRLLAAGADLPPSVFGN